MIAKYNKKDVTLLLWAPVIAAAVFFVLGTVFFLLSLVNAPMVPPDMLEKFTAAVVMTSFILLLTLLFASFHYRKYRKRFFWRMALLGANIIIALLYFFLFVNYQYQIQP